MTDTSRRAKAALRRSRRRDRSNRRRAQRRRSSTLRALTSGALALPGLAGSAVADAPTGRFTADYRASYYKEDDLPSSKVTPGGETSRYEVTGHQFRVAGPVTDRIDLGLDVVYESMSGATPWDVVPDTNGEPRQGRTGATVKGQQRCIYPIRFTLPWL